MRGEKQDAEEILRKKISSCSVTCTSAATTTAAYMVELEFIWD